MTTYDPQRVAGALAVGLGAAGGLGGGGASVGRAVSSVVRGGQQARQRHVKLPHRIFVTVGLDGTCCLHRWPVKDPPVELLRLLPGTFEADSENSGLVAGARVTVEDGRWVVLSGPRRVLRRRAVGLVKTLCAESRTK